MAITVHGGNGRVLGSGLLASQFQNLNDSQQYFNKLTQGQPSSTTHTSGSTSGSTSGNDMLNQLSSAINSNISNLLEAYSTSAIKAERESIASQQKFNAEQAELAWQRSQSSAQKQMDFQAQQADLAWQRSQSSAQKQMDFQAEQAKIQRDYETEMSNTAYQRVVADLKKAGINPLLAVTQGGATTPNAVAPSGSSASAQAMNGASASASSASANKGDYTSAKKADLSFLLGDMFDGIFSSAGKVMSMFARLSAL